MQHDAMDPEKGDRLLAKWGIELTTKLDEKLNDLVVEGSVDAFGSAIGRALVSMFPDRQVEVDLLFGGRSGSLVLTAKVKKNVEGVGLRTELNCVVKVDKDENLIEEEGNTDNILPHLGENAPRVLGGGAHYQELGDTVAVGR